MSTNISKMKREKMLATIGRLKENIGDNKILQDLLLIETELMKKKYGFVWEEYEERADKELKIKIPVFEEVKEKQILDDENRNFNFLLEGDNLHSLYLLEKTHRNKIDIIYIDPPYNTGNKNFIYDDDFVEGADGFRHSKWLSFMSKRLEIAQRLLKKEGVIFISIDDKEQAQLKLICDDIFGEENFVGCLPRRTKSLGKTTNKISANHDYLLIYEKERNASQIIGIEHIDEGFKYEDEYVSERGKYKLNQTLDYDSLLYSSSLDYPIDIKGQTLYPGGDYQKYLERKKGNYCRADWTWRWSKELFEFGLKNGFIVLKEGKNGLKRIYTKTYLNAKIEKDEERGYKVVKQERRRPLSSIEFVEAKYSNDNAKKDLSKILENAKFDYPKPVELLKTLIKIYDNKDAIVLDFFAGSGTTGQAVIEQNRQDNGNRRYILCTNNENNICESITYHRLAKSEKHNLKYYKINYLPKVDTEEENLQKRLMTYTKQMVQLENAVNLTSKNIRIIRSEDEIDKFSVNCTEVKNCKKIYITSDVLLTSKQEKMIQDNNILVYQIPEYYFEKEIEEVQTCRT